MQAVRVWLAAPGIAGELSTGLSFLQLLLTKKVERTFLGENYSMGLAIVWLYTVLFKGLSGLVQAVHGSPTCSVCVKTVVSSAFLAAVAAMT